IKPSSPRRFNSARSAASRGAPAARSLRSSNDWNRASNMFDNLPFRPLDGEGGPVLENQGSPAFEPDAPLHLKVRISGARGISLGVQQTGDDDAAARSDNPCQRSSQLLQWREQNIGKDQIE